MNRIFSGKLLAVLIFVIALLSVACTAKDYSVTAGNWQVDFKSNDTLYTEVDNSNVGYYMIWVKEDPGETTRSSSIMLFEYDNPVPFGKESLKGWMSLLLSSYNKTPTMSDYTIDNTDAVIAEGWSDTFGRIVYAAMYPIDKNSYGSAQRAVGFISLLDKKTGFEILDGLHVDYSDSPLASQTPVTAATNYRIPAVQPVSANSGIAKPYVLIKCKGTLYNNLGQYTKAEPGKVYLVTNLQIENHGYDEFNVNPNYVKVEINNVQYDYSWIGVSDLGLASLDSVTLKDGGITSGSIAFEIPSNANQYSLVWKTWVGESYNVKVEFTK